MLFRGLGTRSPRYEICRMPVDPKHWLDRTAQMGALALMSKEADLQSIMLIRTRCRDDEFSKSKGPRIGRKPENEPRGSPWKRSGSSHCLTRPGRVSGEGYQ